MINELIEIIRRQGTRINPDKLDAYYLDIKDKPFYELVLGKTISKKLVTGNTKHFPKIDNIITPKELVDLMDKV